MQQYICSTQLPAKEVIFSEIKEDIIRSENFFHRHRKEIIHCFSGILFSVVLLIIFPAKLPFLSVNKKAI